MRVLVCGGRDYDEKWFLFDVLNALDSVSVVIQGGAKGADALAKEWANIKGIPCEEFKADWVTYGRAAGPMRNLRMLEDGKPNVVFAFPGGRGTADMIRHARKAGVKVVEFSA